MNLELKPAADYSLPDLVEILNRGFENYFVPIAFNVPTFLNMIRKDGTDLTSSRVLVSDGVEAGIALIARRGWTSRLTAMGVAKESRGLGVGSFLMKTLIDEACARGDREMVLEVIEQNEPAVRLYGKYGFEIVRRLIGFTRKDAFEDGIYKLVEIDIREAARLISQYGLRDLPWQLSGESIAQLNPPGRAFSNGQVCIVISNPEANDIVIWSLIVASTAPSNGLALEMLKSVIATYPGKTWHVPALLPEEFGKVYERAGFMKEELSQWQMRLKMSEEQA